jgi:hypothetical protein
LKISITSHSSSSFFFALFFFCWRFYYTLNHWIAFVVIYLVMIIRVCRSCQHTHPKSFEKTHFYLCVYLSEGVCLLWKERRNINLCHVREMKARWLCAVLGGCNFFTCIIEGENLKFLLIIICRPNFFSFSNIFILSPHPHNSTLCKGNI